MSSSVGPHTPRGPFSGAAPLALRPLSAIAASTAGGVPQARIKRLLSEVLPFLMSLHAQGEICGAISLDTVGMDESARAHLLPEGAAPRTGLVPEPGFAPFELYTDLAEWPRGPWTDVYALCALMHVLVIGLRPPSAPDRRVIDRYEPLASLGLSKYSPVFLGVIDQGLALSPANRPQTLDELAAMLDISDAAEATPLIEATSLVAAAPVAPATVADKPRGAGAPWLALLLLLILTLMGAGVYAWFRWGAGAANALVSRADMVQPKSSVVSSVAAFASARLFEPLSEAPVITRPAPVAAVQDAAVRLNPAPVWVHLESRPWGEVWIHAARYMAGAACSLTERDPSSPSAHLQLGLQNFLTVCPALR